MTKKTINANDFLKVGTGAFGTYYTDLTPFEVVRISPSGKTVYVRKMDYTPDIANGYEYFKKQIYTYSSNHENEQFAVRLTKNGWASSDGMMFRFGEALRYEDPSF